MNETIKTRHRQESSGLMTEGTIWKQILFFAIPLILGNLLQQLYNTVDSIIVGNYVGSNALAAVGASTSLITLLIAFSQGAAVGAGVVVSQFLGARNKKSVESAVHTALTIAGILGIVLTAAGILFTPILLKWMHTPDEIIGEATLYLRIYSGGLIFNVLYNMAAGIINAAGKSRRSLQYLAVASVTNIVLDIILIRGLNFGVEGAAIATDISQLVSSILAISFLMRVKDSYRVSIRKLGIQKDMAIKIIKIGLPAGIQNMAISFSNVLVQSSVNGFGAKAVAGFGAYLKIDGFNILPVLSFSMAATTFVGQNYGAGRMDRVKKGMLTTLGMSVIYTVCIGVILIIFSRPVIGLFTSDSEVITYGQIAMQYFCPFYFLLGILYSLAGTVRGVGKTIPPMVVLLISLCAFRIVWLKTLLPHFDSIRGVFLIYPISWVIGMTLMVLYTWKGNWRPKPGEHFAG